MSRLKFTAGKGSVIHMHQTLYDYCIEKDDQALLRQWHPTRNGELSPHMVVAGSHKQAWWICEKGHEWEARISSRATGRKRGCPICNGKQVLPGYNDLASQRPDIAARWHPTKNGELSPQNITPYSNRKAWWICEKGHEYQAVVRTQGRESRKFNCPYCVGKKILIGYNDLATTQPKIAAQWYQELNGSLTPQMVTAGSNKKAWWICEEGHVWEAVINNRAGKLKNSCPVCAGRHKIKSLERYARIIAEKEAEKRQKSD